METSAGARPPDRHQNQPARLRVRLLGGFALERADGSVDVTPWSRPGAQTIVKVLALAPGHVLSREQVIGLCWPDVPVDAARTRLRVSLHAARRSLEPGLRAGASSSYLVGDGDRLALHPTLVSVDLSESLARATALLTSVTPDPKSRLAELVALENVLARPLLPEDHAADWAAATGRELARAHRATVLALAGCARDAADPTAALPAVERLVELDPSDEELAREVMLLHARSGHLGRAVSAFNRLADVLASEFGTTPTETTRALRARLAPAGGGAAPASADRTSPELRRRMSSPPHVDLPDRAATERELRRWLTDASADLRAPLIVVSGERGSGRTTLVTAALVTLGTGGLVLWGGAWSGEGRPSYGPVVEALDPWLSEQGAARRREVLDAHPRVAALLAGTTTAAPGPADRAPTAHGEHTLFTDTAALLRELADDGPVVLVLEDLQDADLGTVRLLHHLVRTVHHPSLHIVVTLCDESETSPGAADELRQVLTALSRQGLVHRVDLLGLTRRDSDVLVAEILGRRGDGDVAAGVPASDLDRVFELSRGNPLFVSELAHELARERSGDGQRGRGGRRAGTAETPLPSSLTELVEARIAKAPEQVRSVLAVLSVAGSSVSVAEAADTARDGLRPPLCGNDLDDAVDEAVRLRLVDEPDVVADGVTVPGLALRHPLLGLVVLQSLSRARRRRLDGAFAAAVARHRPMAVETVATHLDRAESPEAEEWLLAAARRCATVYADDRADRFHAALSRRQTLSHRPVEETAASTVEWADILVRRGLFGRAEGLLRPLLDQLSPAHPQWTRVVTGLAGVLGRTGRADEGIRLLTTDPYVSAPRGPADDANGLHALADLYVIRGRYSEAIETIGSLASLPDGARSAESAADGGRRVTRRGDALHVRAASLLLLGRGSEAEPYARAALLEGESSGDLALEARALSVLRELSVQSGHLDAALSLGRRVHSLVERVGDPLAHAFERVNLAQTQLALGHDGEARRTAASALRLARSYGDTWCLPYALLGLGEVALRSVPQDAQAARRLLGEAADVARHRGDTQALGAAVTYLAELDIACGDPRAACDRLTGDEAAGAVRATVVRADALVLSDDPAAGLALAREAVAGASGAGDRVLLIDARRGVARALGALGHGDDAWRELREARRIAETIGHRAACRRLEETERWLEGTGSASHPAVAGCDDAGNGGGNGGVTPSP